MNEPRLDLGGEGLSDIRGADLRARIERLSPDALDILPFGVIRLDASGRVTFFSRSEARQSGMGDRPAVGKAFFTELAPCMGTPEFLGRLERASQAGTLDITFESIGDFDDADRELRVRVLSATGGGSWVFIQRKL